MHRNKNYFFRQVYSASSENEEWIYRAYFFAYVKPIRCRPTRSGEKLTKMRLVADICVSPLGELAALTEAHMVVD